MNLEQKQAIVKSLKEKFERATCAIVTDYHGMKVASLQKLRTDIKRKGMEFLVVKNTLLVKAVSEFGYGKEMTPYLKGMTAVAWSREDPSAPARVIRDYQREDEKLKVKCALLDGKVFKPGDLAMIASLPSKEQIKSGFLALLIAPPQRLLALMQAPLSNMLSLLENYRKHKEGSS